MERERTMRRVLSMLLAVLMLVTSVPMDTVYAEELTNTNTMTVDPDNLENTNTNGEGGEPVTQAEVSETYASPRANVNITYTDDSSDVESVYFNESNAFGESDNATKVESNSGAVIDDSKTYYVKVTPKTGYYITGVTGTGATVKPVSDAEGVYTVESINAAVELTITTEKLDVIKFNVTGETSDVEIKVGTVSGSTFTELADVSTGGSDVTYTPSKENAASNDYYFKITGIDESCTVSGVAASTSSTGSQVEAVSDIDGVYKVTVDSSTHATTVDLTVTRTNVITFTGTENIKVEISTASDGEYKDLGKGVKSYKTEGTNSNYYITLTPDSGCIIKKVTINDVEAKDTNGVYTVAVKGNTETVEIEAVQGATLTVKNPDGLLTNVKVNDTTDASGVFIINDGTTATLTMDLPDETYKFYSVDVTSKGTTTSYLNKVKGTSGASSAKEKEFKLELGELKGDTTVTIKVLKKTGQTVSFVGENFYATVSGDSKEYSATYPYVGTVANGSQVSFTLTPVDGYRFVEVPEGAVKGSNGSYTFTVKAENFTDNKFEVEAKVEAVVILDVNLDNATNTTVKVYENGSTNDDEVTANVDGDYIVAAKSDLLVTMTTADNQTKKISKVVLSQDGVDDIDLTESLTGEDRAFEVSLKDLGVDSTLVIKESDDPALMSGITFVDGFYTVTGSSINYAGTESVVLVANTVVSDNLTVKPYTGYKLSKVTFNNETLFDIEDNKNDDDTDKVTVAVDGSISISVTLEDNTQPEFVVETTADKLIGKTKKVTFKFGTPDAYQGKEYFVPEKELSYHVTSAYVSTDANNKHVKTVNEGAEYFTFEVSAPSDVTLDVSLKAKDGTVLKADKSEDGKSFKIAAAALADETEITIDGKVVKKDIKFVYNQKEVRLDAEGTYTNFDSDHVTAEDGTKSYYETYTMRLGRSLTIDLAAMEENGVFVTQITGISNGASFNAEEASFEVIADSDKEIKITSKALESVRVDGLEASEDGSFVVNYKKDYTAKFFKGINQVKVNKADITVDGKTVKELTAKENGAVVFNLGADLAGKAVVLNLKTVDDKETATVVASIRLTVCEALVDVSVVGVENDILTQTVDTEKEWELVLTEGASFADLKAVASNCKAEVTEEGTLKVTTLASKAAERAATIKLVNQRDNKILRTITVNTKAVTGLASAVPSVSSVNGTEMDLVVNLAAEGVEDVVLNAGGIYYKVSVTPVSGDGKKPKATTYYVEKVGSSQVATLENVLGIDTSKEKGRAYNFDLKVQLVQLDNQSYTDNAVNRLDVSKESETKSGFATKTPYYSSTVELNQLEKVVYTGQSGIAVAKANFGKETSYISGDAYVVGAATGWFATVVDVDGMVYLTVSSAVEPGTYTLVVKSEVPKAADGKELAVPATASIDFKVENGVWDVDIQNLPETIFKSANKASSVKATVLLNRDPKAKVKNKKVTWEIAKAVDVKDGYPVLTKFASGDYLYNMVTVKNGTVSVNKDYKVSSIEANNTFYVVAISESNGTAYAAEKVTITGQSVELGELHFAVLTDKGYEVLPEVNNASTITSDIANSGDLYLIAVRKDLVKSVYKPTDLLKTSLSLKVPTSVQLEGTQTNDGAFHVEGIAKTAKNIKFVVSTMDGGKSSKTELLTVNYTNIENMKVQMGTEYSGGNITDGTVYGTTPYKFTGTNEDIIYVRIGTETEKDGAKTFVPFTGQANVKVSIKGGKLVKLSVVDSTLYAFKITSDKATLTIKNQDNKKADPTICEIINNGYATGKAPTVKTTVKSLLAYSEAKQSIEYTSKDAIAYKYVRVQVSADDYARQLTAFIKNGKASVYGDVLAALTAGKGGDIILPIKDKGFTLNFEGCAIPAGTAKLAFTYGDYNVSGVFVPATKTVNMSVKFEALKTVEYTAQTNYALSLKDTVSTALTGTAGKNTKAIYADGTYNAIVDGASNDFTTYFGAEDGKLYIKDVTGDSKKLEKLKKMVAAEDANLHGYVKYSIDGAFGEQYAEVNVSLKDILKTYTYEASPATLLATSGVKTSLRITSNGEDVKVVKATIPSTGAAFTAVEDGKGNVTLTSKTLTVGENAATLAFIPDSSYYATYSYKNANAKTDGVSLDFKLNAVNSASDIITIKDYSAKFTSYDAGTYTAKIPYTSNIANAVSFKAKDTDTVKLSSYLKFTTEDGNILVNMSKSSLTSAVKAGKAEYGKTYDVTVTADFKGLVSTEYTFKITMPTESSLDGSAVEKIFTDIRKAIWNDPSSTADDARYFPVSVDFTKVDEARKDDADNDELKALYGELTQAAVLAAAKAEIPVGADIAVASTVTVTLPTIVNEGNAVVSLTFSGSDYKTYQADTKVDGTSNKIDVTVTLPKTEADIMDSYEAAIRALDMSTLMGEVDNNITKDDILNAIRTEVLGSNPGDYRILAKGDMDITKAEEGTAGSARLTVYVKNVKDIEYFDGVTVSITIPALQSLADAANAFTNISKTGVFDEFIKTANETTKAEDILALANSVITNSDIKVDFKKDNEFKITTKDGAQKDENGETIQVANTMTFTLEYKNSKNETEVVSVSEDLTNTDYTAVDVVSLVEAAVNGKDGYGEFKALVFINNDKDASRANLEAAAQAALKNAPYKVSISTSDWDYTAPTYTKDGEVSYTIRFEALAGAPSVSETVTVNYLAIPKDNNYQTLDEAEAAVKKAFEAVADYTEAGLSSIEKAAVLAIVSGEVKDDDSTNADNRKLVLSYKSVIDPYFSDYADAFTITAPTVKEDGKVEVTFVIEEQKAKLDADGNPVKDTNGSTIWETVDSRELTMDKTIKRTPQTVAMEKKAAEDALKAFKANINEHTTATQIINVVENVLDTSIYVEITFKTGSPYSYVNKKPQGIIGVKSDVSSDTWDFEIDLKNI